MANQKCQKIVLKKTDENNRQIILFGLILEDKDGFIKLKTGKNTHSISKDLIALIRTTNIDFVEEK